MFSLSSVLIADELDIQCDKILQSNGINVYRKVGLTVDELLLDIKNYDGLIVRSATKVTRRIIEAATQLKVVGRAGTGVDNIDLEAASEHGVLVMNTPGGNTISAVEHTCALMVALTRQIHLADASMRAGRWDRKLFMGTELFGKTLAVIGLGRIGREVAFRMRSFGMRTIGFDPIIGGEESIKFGVEWMSLDDLWAEADYITVHVPLIPQTANLICKDTLDRCKNGVIVLNVARGGIINENDLLDGLNSGKVGGAALDVFEEEPLRKDSLLRTHPKVLCTPHLGASTEEAQLRVAIEIAEQFVELSAGRGVTGAVNGQGLAVGSDQIAWSGLASKLAQLGAAGQHKEFVLTVPARLISMKNVLSSAVMSGLLQSGSQLNPIKALKEAANHGLSVECIPGTDLWEMSLASVDKSFLVRGTVDPYGRSNLTVYSGHRLNQALEISSTLLICDPSLVTNEMPVLAFSSSSSAQLSVYRLSSAWSGNLPVSALQIIFNA